MWRQTLSMSRQSLLYSLSLTKLFVSTLDPLSRQTCLGSSHLFSIFYRNINLLLSNFYCRDIIFLFCNKISAFSSSLCRNICFCVAIIFLSFSSLSTTTIVAFVATTFTLTSSFLCCNREILCRDKVCVFFITNSECCVAKYFSSVAT